MATIRDRENVTEGLALGLAQSNPAANLSRVQGTRDVQSLQQLLGRGAVGAAGKTPAALSSLQRLLGAGQQELAAAGRIDPRQEFNQLRQLLAPVQEQERSELESRLFAQGRLGGTGGANEQEALRAAQGQVLQQGALQSIGSARDARTQAINNALQLTSGGVGGLQGIQQQGLQGLIGLNQAQLQQLLGTKSLEPVGTKGGFGGTLGGLAGGALGSLAGPLGTAAGSALGGQLFGGQQQAQGGTSSGGGFSAGLPAGLAGLLR